MMFQNNLPSFICLFFSIILINFNVYGQENQIVRQDSVQVDTSVAYTIKVNVKGIQNDTAYLGYHFGHKVFIKDTALIDGQGNVIFEGKEALKGGIYLAIFPKKRFFEVLIDEDQTFEIQTDPAHLVNNMSVKGSEDNTDFNAYQRFLDQQQQQIKAVKALVDTLYAQEKNDSADVVKAQLKVINNVTEDYRKAFVEKKPNCFLSKIFVTMMDPVIPDAPIGEDGAVLDPHFTAKYYRQHFWDQVDFADERLLRTPLLYNKTKYYLDQITFQYPDSINLAADFILEKARVNKELFRYLVTTVTHKYETSKIIGMDAVFVHLVDTYYLTGDAYWMKKEVLQKIGQRVARLRPNLLGKKAPNIALFDTSETKVELYDLDNNYTVLFFWDYKCGHCKKSMPQMKEVYDKYKAKGVDFYSVCTRIEKKPWTDYLKKAGIEEFVNVMDPFSKSPFRQLYDVHTTPLIYILDAKKTIKIKRIGAKQLDKFLGKYLAEDAKK